jgi:hypothetical protein
MATAQESQAAQEVLGKGAGDEEAPKPVTTEQQSVPETVTDPVTSDEVRPTQGVDEASEESTKRCDNFI